MKSKTVALSLITLLSIFAFAGCQGTPTDTTPTDETKTEETTDDATKTDDTAKTEDSAVKAEVTVPEGATDKIETGAGNNKVVVYNVKATVDEACKAASKSLTDNGWKATLEPVNAGGTWAQTLEGGNLTAALACMTDPVKKDMTKVSVTMGEKPAM
jgi:hypothetical protein